MLRHTGERRSFTHNLRLAILLSLNAGFINAAGFIAFAVLTTNVTGHAALLAVDMATGQFRAARMAAAVFGRRFCLKSLHWQGWPRQVICLNGAYHGYFLACASDSGLWQQLPPYVT